MQQHPELRGVRATTIRALGRHLWLIDEEFRQNPRNHRLFHEILRAPVGVTHELRRLNLYGVLGRYIPAFGRIVGRMQYDLFHAYTVDAHTLFVVRNLRRLALPRFEHEFPELSRLMATAAQARARLSRRAVSRHRQGTRRRSLGAGRRRCRGVLPRAGPVALRRAARRVAGATPPAVLGDRAEEGHLGSAGDPRVSRGVVGDQTHLDYLYLLTVADVRGTNPKLWNSWKAALFADFYERTKRALRRGLESPLDQEELVAEMQAAARDECCPARARRGAGRRGLDALQRRVFPAAHARRDRLAHQAAGRARPRRIDRPLVAVRHTPERGGNAVLTFLPHRQQNFARTTALLDQMGLNILDARITPLEGGMSLDTYLVLEDNGAPIADRHRAQEIEQQLWRVLQGPEAALPVVTRRAPRQVRMFTTPTQITFTDDPRTEPHHPRADRGRPAGPALRDRQGIPRRAHRRHHRQDHDDRRARRGRVLRDRRPGPGLVRAGAADAPGSAVRGARPPRRGQARLSAPSPP